MDLKLLHSFLSIPIQTDAGDNITHAVIIAYLFMLVPRSSLTALRGPFANLIRIFLGIGKEQSTSGARYDLISIEPPVTKE